MKIICCANQKGGVGKTTTIVNLATALSALRKPVLLIDFDPQGNASSSFGISHDDRDFSAYDIMTGNCSLQEAAKKTHIPDLYIIPSRVDLAAIEIEGVNTENREKLLKNTLSTIENKYAYVLIDCPPSLGLLTLNALVACDEVLVPLQCEFFALEGLGHLLSTINRVRANYNHKIEINGIVLTMFDRRMKLMTEIEDDVRGFLGEKVYDAVIPRNIKVSEAPSFGRPVMLYDHDCSASLAYMKFASEFLKRQANNKIRESENEYA